MGTNSSVRVWLLLLLMFAATLILAACGSPPATPADTRQIANSPAPNVLGATSVAALAATDVVDVREVRRALTAREAESYLGGAVCAACHKEAAAQHALSRHAHTLRPVSVAQDGANFRNAHSVTDPTLRYTYTPSVEQGKCVLRGRNARGQAALPADYVMGNGHNAYTYLNRDDAKGWVELRLSYYPQAHAWSYTPTQLPGALLKRAAGEVQTNAMLTSCLLCHTTVLRAAASSQVSQVSQAATSAGTNAVTEAAANTPPDDPLPDLAASRLGVGCERCHGPGRAHVTLVTQAGIATATAALKARHNTYGMEDLHTASPDRINALCGYCHRTTENAEAGPHTEMNMARFQGVALARSGCYQQSGALSCLTCHNAHSNANPSLSRNDAICLRCHNTQAAHPATTNTERTNTATVQATAAAATLAAHTAGPENSALSRQDNSPSARIVAGKICPVNAHTGCTTCHMPKQSIADIPNAVYTNHWIKVWRETPSTRVGALTP